MSTGEIRELGLDEVMPGTVLAADVHDGEGNLLLHKGAAVTESMLAGLRHRGVATLQVVHEERLSPDQQAERRRQVLERVRYLFRASGDSPVARELERQITAYRLQEHA